MLHGWPLSSAQNHLLCDLSTALLTITTPTQSPSLPPTSISQQQPRAGMHTNIPSSLLLPARPSPGRAENCVCFIHHQVQCPQHVEHLSLLTRVDGGVSEPVGGCEEPPSEHPLWQESQERPFPAPCDEGGRASRRGEETGLLPVCRAPRGPPGALTVPLHPHGPSTRA